MKDAANLFIIGAPKCGTTSLASWLQQHPEVFVPKEKEPHLLYSPTINRVSALQYRKIYAESSDISVYSCDASTSYLFGGSATNIFKDHPESRFIVCIRDPVQMLPSFFNEQKISGLELAPDIETAWEVSERRTAGEAVFLNSKEVIDARFFSLKRACALGSQLEKFSSFVDSSKIYPVRIEEMRDKPHETFTRICKWLGISEEVTIRYVRKNSSVRNRSEKLASLLRAARTAKRFLGYSHSFGVLKPLQRANETPSKQYRLSGAFLEEVESYFKNERCKIDKMLRILRDAPNS